MTFRECAIIMAHTGICMLEGDAFNEFYKYLEELYGRPVYTHEIAFLGSEIKERSTADFISLCKAAQPEQRWIPCNARLPEQGQEVICQCRASIIKVLKLDANGDWYQDANHCYMGGFVIAWMPLPEPYKGETDNDYERAVEQMEHDTLYEPTYNSEDGSM